jgi:hypothetical protein
MIIIRYIKYLRLAWWLMQKKRWGGSQFKDRPGKKRLPSQPIKAECCGMHQSSQQHEKHK